MSVQSMCLQLESLQAMTSLTNWASLILSNYRCPSHCWVIWNKTQKKTEQHQCLSQNHNMTHVWGVQGTLILSQLMVFQTILITVTCTNMWYWSNYKKYIDIKQTLNCAIWFSTVHIKRSPYTGVTRNWLSHTMTHFGAGSLFTDLVTDSGWCDCFICITSILISFEYRASDWE